MLPKPRLWSAGGRPLGRWGPGGSSALKFRVGQHVPDPVTPIERREKPVGVGDIGVESRDICETASGGKRWQCQPVKLHAEGVRLLCYRGGRPSRLIG